MVGLISSIASISGGILLAMDTLDRWDGDKDIFKKIGTYLTPYNTIIGGILIAVGILYFKSLGTVYSLVNIAAGLLLLANVLGKTPAIGKLLVKTSKALVPFKVGIGLSLLVMGVLRLF